MELMAVWGWLTQTPFKTACTYAAIAISVFFVLMVAGSLYEDWQKRREKR